MGTCVPCDISLPDDELVDHIRLMHPAEYGTGPERWSDGELVINDNTLDPDDFREPRST